MFTWETLQKLTGLPDMCVESAHKWRNVTLLLPIRLSVGVTSWFLVTKVSIIQDFCLLIRSKVAYAADPEGRLERRNNQAIRRKHRRKKTFPRLTKFSTFVATSLLPVAPPE